MRKTTRPSNFAAALMTGTAAVIALAPLSAEAQQYQSANEPAIQGAPDDRFDRYAPWHQGGSGERQWSAQDGRYQPHAQPWGQQSWNPQYGGDRPPQPRFDRYGQAYGQGVHGQDGRFGPYGQDQGGQPPLAQGERFGQNDQPYATTPYGQPPYGQYGPAYGETRFGPSWTNEPWSDEFDRQVIAEADRNGDGRIDTQEYVEYRRTVLRQANRGDYRQYYTGAFRAYPELRDGVRDDRVVVYGDLTREPGELARRQRMYRWSGSDEAQGQYLGRQGDERQQAYAPPAGPYGGQAEFDRFGRPYPQERDARVGAPMPGVAEPYPQFGQFEGQQPEGQWAERQGNGFGRSGQAQWLPEQEILDRVRAQGYSEISRVTWEGDIYAIEAQRNGENVTLEVDARTGQILGEARG